MLESLPLTFIQHYQIYLPAVLMFYPFFSPLNAFIYCVLPSLSQTTSLFTCHLMYIKLSMHGFFSLLLTVTSVLCAPPSFPVYPPNNLERYIYGIVFLAGKPYCWTLSSYFLSSTLQNRILSLLKPISARRSNDRVFFFK